MSVVKSIVRWFFGCQALVLILIPVVLLIGNLTMHPGAHAGYVVSRHLAPAASAVTGFMIVGAALLVAIGAVFAMAWWSARKPSATRNLWAIAASILYIAEGAAGFVYVRRHGPSQFGLEMMAVGVAGLFVFLRSENVPDSAIAAKKRAPVAGDRTSIWTRHVATSLAVIAQIVAMVLWGRWAYSHELLRSRGIMWLALVALTSVLTTVIHECGHAVMAWCFEMGLLSFKAGPFQWAKREGKWKFKFHFAGLLTAGGAVGAVPTNPEQPRWEEILMIAAGPLGNLLFGIPAIWAVQHDNWVHYQQTWEVVAFTGSFCLIAAVLNLFPFMSEEGSYSDGARILQIVTHSPLDDYHRTLASIASTVITARRYRDLDIAAIERAASLFPNEYRGLHLRLCACNFYEDSGRLPEASAALAAAEGVYNKFSVELPGPLHTIFVIGHAYLNRDAAAARLWWDRMEAKKCERSNVDYWLAKTALHWIEGNLQEANEAWQKADSEARDLPQFGTYEFDRFRCAMLREALDKPSQVLAPTITSIANRTPATATRAIVTQSAPAPTRQAPAITPASAARPAIAQLHQVSNVTAAAEVFDPLARLFRVSASPTPAPVPATAVLAERSPQIDLPASTVQTALTIAPTAIASSTAITSVTIAPTAITPLPESNLPQTDVAVARAAASFTRIPASSIVAPEPPFARVALLPVPGQGSATSASTGVVPSLKAPAVPAAFARRAVRPVPAPPSNLYAEIAVATTAATTDFSEPVTAALPTETPVVTTLVSPTVAARKQIPPPPPTAALTTARFDPLEFIRAAALENLPT